MAAKVKASDLRPGDVATFPEIPGSPGFTARILEGPARAHRPGYIAFTAEDDKGPMSVCVMGGTVVEVKGVR